MRPSAFLLLLAAVCLENVPECYGQRTTPHTTSGPQRTTPKKPQQQHPGTRPSSTVAHSTQKPLKSGGQNAKLVASTTKPNPQRTTLRAITMTTRKGTTAKGTQLSRTTTAPHSQKMQKEITTRRNGPLATTTMQRRPVMQHFSIAQLARGIIPLMGPPIRKPEDSTSKTETTTKRSSHVTFSTRFDDDYDIMEINNGSTVTTETEVNTTVAMQTEVGSTVTMEIEGSSTVTMDSESGITETDSSSTVAMETEGETTVTTETEETNPAEDSTENTTAAETTLTEITNGESTTPGTEGSTRKKLKRRKVTTTTTTEVPPKRVLKRRKVKVVHANVE